MKKLSLLVLMTLSSLAMANQTKMGAGSSGGGDAIVCYEDGLIKSAKLMDLYEGESIFGDDQISRMGTNSYKELINQALTRLKKTSYGIESGHDKGRSVVDLIDLVETRKKLIAEDARLKNVEDSYEAFIPNHCAVEQAALFIDENTILFDRRIWNKFSELDKAALIIHEAVYYIDRITSMRFDSRRTRRIVSQVFSKDWAFESVTSGIPMQYILCGSFNSKDSKKVPMTHFLAFKTGDAITLQFLNLNGDPVISKKTLVVPVPADDNASYTYYGYTDSLYEDKDQLQLYFGQSRTKVDSFLGRNEKVSYPAAIIAETDFRCYEVDETKRPWLTKK